MHNEQSTKKKGRIEEQRVNKITRFQFESPRAQDRILKTKRPQSLDAILTRDMCNGTQCYRGGGRVVNPLSQTEGGRAVGLVWSIGFESKKRSLGIDHCRVSEYSHHV